jgi:hypothetical protein
MAAQKYYLEELDDATRGYLRAVHASKGNGMAGIYVPANEFGPGCVLFVGILVVAATLYFIWPPLNDPTNITLWLTAGILLGGWLILAALRIWIGRSRGTNFGSFLYADPWNLWNVAGTKVDHLDMGEVTGVNLVENRDKEGNYQSSTVQIITDQQQHELKMHMEIGAREIHAYIEYWLQARGGAPLSKSLVDEHAALARGYAYDQEVLPGEQLPLDIPKPERVRTYGFGWLNLISVVAAGVGLFFLLHPLVLAWRDDAIFELVQHRAPNELRAYLVDPRNTRHREQVAKLLAAKYEPRIQQFQNRIRANKEPGALVDSAEPMGLLLQSIATAIQPALSVRVRETKSDLLAPDAEVGSANERVEFTRKQLVDDLQGNMSEFYLSVAKAPEDEEKKDVPAHIDVEYKILRDMAADTYRIHATITMRKTPDDALPLYTGVWQSQAFRDFETRSHLTHLVHSFTGTGIYPPFNDDPQVGDWGM